MANADYITSKTILAKLLATENITVEIQDVPTAHFELDSRKLVLPVMKNDISPSIFNMLTGHEVGHAIYTSSSKWQRILEKENLPQGVSQGTMHGILNIVEDARIEKLIKRKYPGIKKDFFQAYKELIQRDFFGIQENYNGNYSLMGFADRINVFFKCGSLVDISFSAEEQIFIDKITIAETFEEVVQISYDIVDFVKSYSGKGDISLPNDSKEVIKGSGNSENSEDEGDLEGNSPPINPDDIAKKIDENEDEEKSLPDLETKTDKKWEENKQKLFEKAGVIWNLNIPNLDPKEYIIPYTTVMEDMKRDVYKGEKAYKEYLQHNTPMVGHLFKEFELKKNADQLRKVKTAKTGNVDVKRLHSYKYSEDIFLRNTIVDKGKSHGLMLFIDWSGSMDSKMYYSARQLLCLIDFCRRAKIPYEAYAFSNSKYMMQDKRDLNRFKVGDIWVERFNLIQLFTNRMSHNEYVAMAKIFLHVASVVSNTENPYMLSSNDLPRYFQLAGTPLDSTIMVAMEMVPDFKKRNNLQVVNTVFVTDGDSDFGAAYKSGLDETQSYGYNRAGSAFIRDPKTGNIIKIAEDVNTKMTSTLLEHLRYRTDANVVGFFIGESFKGSPWSGYMMETYYGVKYNLTPEQKAKGKKDNFLIVDNQGYNEFYIIPVDSMVINTNTLKDELDKKYLSSRNRDKIINDTIVNLNKERIKNRFILSRFIDIIV